MEIKREGGIWLRRETADDLWVPLSETRHGQAWLDSLADFSDARMVNGVQEFKHKDTGVWAATVAPTDTPSVPADVSVALASTAAITHSGGDSLSKVPDAAWDADEYARLNELRRQDKKFEDDDKQKLAELEQIRKDADSYDDTIRDINKMARAEFIKKLSNEMNAGIINDGEVLAFGTHLSDPLDRNASDAAKDQSQIDISWISRLAEWEKAKDVPWEDSFLGVLSTEANPAYLLVTEDLGIYPQTQYDAVPTPDEKTRLGQIVADANKFAVDKQWIDPALARQRNMIAYLNDVGAFGEGVLYGDISQPDYRTYVQNLIINAQNAWEQNNDFLDEGKEIPWEQYYKDQFPTHDDVETEGAVRGLQTHEEYRGWETRYDNFKTQAIRRGIITDASSFDAIEMQHLLQVFETAETRRAALVLDSSVGMDGMYTPTKEEDRTIWSQVLNETTTNPNSPLINEQIAALYAMYNEAGTHAERVILDNFITDYKTALAAEEANELTGRQTNLLANGRIGKFDIPLSEKAIETQDVKDLNALELKSQGGSAALTPVERSEMYRLQTKLGYPVGATASAVPTAMPPGFTMGQSFDSQGRIREEQLVQFETERTAAFNELATDIDLNSAERAARQAAIEADYVAKVDALPSASASPQLQGLLPEQGWIPGMLPDGTRAPISSGSDSNSEQFRKFFKRLVSGESTSAGLGENNARFLEFVGNQELALQADFERQSTEGAAARQDAQQNIIDFQENLAEVDPAKAIASNAILASASHADLRSIYAQELRPEKGLTDFSTYLDTQKKELRKKFETQSNARRSSPMPKVVYR